MGVTLPSESAGSFNSSDGRVGQHSSARTALNVERKAHVSHRISGCTLIEPCNSFYHTNSRNAHVHVKLHQRMVWTGSSCFQGFKTYQLGPSRHVGPD